MIIEKYNRMILVSSDDTRKILNLKGHSYKGRFGTILKYCNLVKLSTTQKINVYS